jgi:hypothetical protein
MKPKEEAKAAVENPIRAKLILDVTYVPGTTHAEEVRSLLQAAGDHLANEGLLTGDGPAEVESWSVHVKVASPKEAPVHVR